MPNKDALFRAVTAAHRAVFRASGGRLLGRAAGMPVLMLTTTGRRSGRTRRTMLTSPLVEGGRVVVVASFGGDDRHPAWYLNVVANPDVTLTMAGTTRAVRARVAGPDEKADLWPRIVQAHSRYAGYQRRTDREIPLVVLEPYAGTG